MQKKNKAVEKLIRITTHNACAGLIIKNYICIDTAPILYKFRGLSFDLIKIICKRRNWKIEVIECQKKYKKKRKRLIL